MNWNTGIDIGKPTNCYAVMGFVVHKRYSMSLEDVLGLALHCADAVHLERLEPVGRVGRSDHFETLCSRGIRYRWEKMAFATI